ncbi:retrovirus-related pol polyprotein from transposon TNT 1-94 [Tanacetum coccineum]
MKTVFNQMKAAVEQCSVERKYFDIQKKDLSLDNDRLLDHIICQDVMNIVMHVDSVENLALRAELAKKEHMIGKNFFDEAVLRCSRLENRCEFFNINEWKMKLNAKDVSIANLRKHIESLRGKNIVEKDLPPNKAHVCFLEFVNDVKVNSKSKSAKRRKKKQTWKPTGKVFTDIGYRWKPTGQTFTIVGNSCPLTRITSTKVEPLKETTLKSVTTPNTEIKLYRRKTKVAKLVDLSCETSILGSRSTNISEPNKHWGSTALILHLLLLSILSCPDYLEVAFCKHTCYIRDLDCGDLLKGSRGTNLYTLYLEGMMSSSPICLLSKALKIKSWLWHRRLSHLNFNSITALAKQGLVHGLPKLMFQKDHLCSVCALGKRKKHTHKPKAEDSIQEKLYLLHMDLCGPMRIQSINGRKYILVIVKNYSRFKWMKFLRSKDEVPEFMIKFLQNNSRPGPQLLTHGTLSSGLVPNTPSPTPYVPPTKKDWDTLFQPMFDEYFNPPSSVASPVPAVIALDLIDSTDLPSSTLVDQDAPSLSTSQTPQETQPPFIPSGIEEEFYDIEVAYLDNNPFFGVRIPKPNSEESSLTYVISTNVHSVNQPLEHLRKWTKDHPLDKVIGSPSRHVSSRNQLQNQAMFCYFNAFLTSVKLKNYKEALKESCWIEAMQEELNEFE